jgi:predicted RNA-binding Zn-ribbon protein involved in translation (DUF1610 family)
LICPECGCDSMHSCITCPDWQVDLPDEEQDQSEVFSCDNCGFQDEIPIVPDE